MILWGWLTILIFHIVNQAFLFFFLLFLPWIWLRLWLNRSGIDWIDWLRWLLMACRCLVALHSNQTGIVVQADVQVVEERIAEKQSLLSESRVLDKEQAKEALAKWHSLMRVKEHTAGRDVELVLM